MTWSQSRIFSTWMRHGCKLGILRLLTSSIAEVWYLRLCTLGLFCIFNQVLDNNSAPSSGTLRTQRTRMFIVTSTKRKIDIPVSLDAVGKPPEPDWEKLFSLYISPSFSMNHGFDTVVVDHQKHQLHFFDVVATGGQGRFGHKLALLLHCLLPLSIWSKSGHWEEIYPSESYI